MNNIFDTHAHYSSRQFDADRAELLTALPAGGVVGVLECATHSGDAAQVLELAHAAPYFHAALGIHPESLIEEDAATVAVYHGDWRAELAAMRPLFADKAVAAVGEIGLDHHWPVPRQEQYDLFEAQLQLAKELDLPVSVHDREAHAEMYELLRKYKPRGALHCYSGSADDAAWLLSYFEDQDAKLRKGYRSDGYMEGSANTDRGINPEAVVAAAAAQHPAAGGGAVPAGGLRRGPGHELEGRCSGRGHRCGGRLPGRETVRREDLPPDRRPAGLDRGDRGAECPV